MLDLNINREQLEQNICEAKAKGLVLPNLAQIRTPDLITEAYGEEFRTGWYNDKNGGWRSVPVFREILPEESGVPCRILALTGDAARGAAYCCELCSTVTGTEADPELAAALWQYNVTGWALADLFESRKHPGDRLFGVCFGKVEAGILAAGDLIKARYPRAKLAAGSVADHSNVRNLDVLCKSSDPVQCCIAVAQYFELEEHDVLLTVLPENDEKSADACVVRELSYPEKKKLNYSRGLSETMADAMWKPEYWAELYDQMIDLDILINAFNDAE